MAFQEVITKTNSLTKAKQVMFKHGTQASLDQLRKDSGAETGVFYLTNDTHRLYIGNDANVPVPVNEGIIRYANLASAIAALGITSSTTDRQPDLAGVFVYLEEEGVLAIFNGSDLIQINSDTNTTYKFTETLSETTQGVVTVTSTLFGKERTGTNYDISAGEFTFSLEGKNGIVLDLNTNKVTVTGPAYKVISGTNSSTAHKNSYAEVGLTYVDPADNTEKTASSFKIKGSADVRVSGAKNGDVTIEAVDTILTDLIVTEKATNGFEILVKDGKTQVADDIDPRITLGSNSTEYHFNKGVANLPVYTKEEIDSIIVDFDAMEYMGVFPTSGGIKQLSSLTNVKKGDTYKAAQNLTVASNGVKADAGDLIIANGTETNGVLTSITWEVVPSGNEDTTYRIESETGGFTLVGKSSIGSSTTDNNDSGTIYLKEKTDDKITVSQNITNNAAGDDIEFVFSHKETSRSDTTSTAYDGQSGVAAEYVKKSVTLLTIDASANQDGVATDKWGHVTGTKQKSWTIKDTNAVMDSMTVAAVASDNLATVTLTPALRQSDGTVKSASGNLLFFSKNANLTVAAENNKIDIDLVWGTF
jgi:hypothetical protein